MGQVLNSPYEVTRQILPHYLNAKGLTGKGVEVGVAEGLFSECILKTWHGFLYCVDAWADLPGYEESYPQDANYQSATERLAPYWEHCELLRMTSLQAARAFEDESLDFVYLDADHTYSGVLADLEAWYPKLVKGGLFCGDDYGAWPITAVEFKPGVQHLFGVKKAVDEFASRMGRNVSIDWIGQWSIPWEGNSYWARNWYWLK